MNRIRTSNSTLAGYRAALEHFDRIQLGRGDPTFDELVEVDVQGDHLKKLLLTTGKIFARAQVYKFNNPDNGTIVVSTKKQFFSKWKEALREKFPHHPDWVNHEQVWWNLLSKDFEAEGIRYRQRDDDSTDRANMPFYHDLKPDMIFSSQRSALLRQENGKARDGTELCMLLMKSCRGMPQLQYGPLQQRKWYVDTALSVGRGSELMLCRHDEMYWDPILENVDGNWSEMKTLTQQSIVCGPNKCEMPFKTYYSDWFHASGSFFAVEGGLARGDDVHPHKIQYVYTQLQGLSNNTVAAKTSALLQNYVLDCVKDQTTSRSIRRGITTQLSLHPQMNEFLLNAIGGWAEKSNSKTYKRITPKSLYPGMNALGFWDNIMTPKKAPRLECLGAHVQDQLEAFMEKLYVVDVELYKPGNRLRPMLRACTASLIMYHPDVLRDFGRSNLIAEKVTDAAAEAEIADDQHTDPEAVLKHWSQKIREDFCLRNPDQKPDHDTMDLREEIKAQRMEIRNLHEKHNTLSISFNDFSHNVLTSVTSTLSNFKEDVIATLRPQRRSMSTSPAASTTSASYDQSSLGSTTSLSEQPSTTSIENNSTARVSVQSSANKRSAAGIPGAQSKKKKAKSIGHSSRAEIDNLSGVTLFQYLAELHKAGILKNKCKEDLSGVFLCQHKEMDKIRAAMSLAACVVTDDQWENLTKADAETEVMNAGRKTAEDCCCHLFDWEVQAGIQDGTVDHKKTKATVKMVALVF